MHRKTDMISLTATQQVVALKDFGFSKEALLQAIAEVYETSVQNNVLSEDVENILADYQKFYKEEMNIDLDISNIKIPEYKEGFGRILVIAKGLTINQVIKACEKHFKVWTYTNDLDKAVTQNGRTSSESYAIRIRGRQEADEELKNMSANQLANENASGITLLERFVFELKYFKETGKHLDMKNITLCSGSRHSGGSVPDVRWRDDELRVGWSYPAHAHSHLRSRAVVSLPF